jgi:hypothetical protein
MDLAWIAIGLGACYFMVSVGLDKSKTPLQRWVTLVIGSVVSALVVFGLWF